MNVTRLHVALRELDYKQLCKLRTDVEKKNGIENDIQHYLKILEVKKNLLLFYSFSFSFDVQYDFDTSNDKIKEALSDDFEISMQYRHNAVEGFDIYIAYIFNEYIVFMQESKNRFNVIDCIKLSESPTYMKLLNYVSVF